MWMYQWSQSLSMLYTILVMPFRSHVIPTGQPTGYFVVAFGLGEPVGGWKWDLATLRAIDCGQSLHCVVADTFGLVRTPFQDLTDFTCRFAATVATSGWPLGKRWRPLRWRGNWSYQCGSNHTGSGATNKAPGKPFDIQCLVKCPRTEVTLPRETLQPQLRWQC